MSTVEKVKPPIPQKPNPNPTRKPPTPVVHPKPKIPHNPTSISQQIPNAFEPSNSEPPNADEVISKAFANLAQHKAALDDALNPSPPPRTKKFKTKSTVKPQAIQSGGCSPINRPADVEESTSGTKGVEQAKEDQESPLKNSPDLSSTHRVLDTVRKIQSRSSPSKPIPRSRSQSSNNPLPAADVNKDTSANSNDEGEVFESTTELLPPGEAESQSGSLSGENDAKDLSPNSECGLSSASEVTAASEVMESQEGDKNISRQKFSPPVPKPRVSLLHTCTSDVLPPQSPKFSNSGTTTPPACEDIHDAESANITHSVTVVREGSSTPSPKAVRRRPSEPPPLPPASLSSPRRPLPKRPPPPVPDSKSAKLETDSNPAPTDTSTTTDTELKHTGGADNAVDAIYDTPDVGSDTSEHVAAHTNDSDVETASLPDTLAPAVPAITVYQHPDNDSHGDDVYLVPDSSGEVKSPTLPPRNPPVLLNADTKSATLLSVESNVYEDLDSESDDNRSSVSIHDAYDIYSDTLDETLENDISQKGSSSESETEENVSEQQKQEAKKQKAFNVAHEIMTSEQTFIDILVLLNIDFRRHIMNAAEETGEEIIPTSSMNNILKHLPLLSNINEDLLKDLEHRVSNWEENPKIADIFVKKGAFLKMYTNYMKDFQSMNVELDSAIKEHPAFATKLREFEQSDRCKNLLLRHYMLKPIQRIPQYRLLLTQYQKCLPDDSPDKDDVQKALDIVSRVADHSNEAMKESESMESLLELQNILVGDFEVIKPSRVLLRRGDLYKQSRKELQHRTLFLFNDNLLITSPQPGGYYRVKYVLPLIKMQVNKPTREDFKKEFRVVTKKRSFAAEAFTPKERDNWVEALEKAIVEQERKMETYQQGHGFKDGDNSDNLGDRAPVWIPDDRVTMCVICNDAFTVLHRRHHCRACGKVVCGGCSDFKAPLKYAEFGSRRVCSVCYSTLYSGYHLCTTHEQPGVVPSLSGKKERKENERGQLLAAHAYGETLTSKFKASTKQDPNKAPKIRNVLVEVHANELGECSGYLNVYIKRRHWKKYWFVLKDNVLYKYNANEDTAAIDTTVLLGYDVTAMKSPFDGYEAGFMFKLDHAAPQIDPILFRCETTTAAEQWISKMEESTHT